MCGGRLGAQSGYLGSRRFPRGCKVSLQSNTGRWLRRRPLSKSNAHVTMLASEAQGCTGISCCSCTCACLTCNRMRSSSLSACKPFRKLMVASLTHHTLKKATLTVHNLAASAEGVASYPCRRSCEEKRSGPWRGRDRKSKDVRRKRHYSSSDCSA